MPYTLGGAILKYREDTVDLDPDQTKRARLSRDFLFTQIKALDSGNEYIFPKLYKDPKPYGSFARSTKIRPLDDIDFLVPLDGTGTTATGPHNDDFSYFLRIDDRFSPLEPYHDDDDSINGTWWFGYVNSIKILNTIKSALTKVSYYAKADLKRNQEAVALSLKSHDWSFDIVPAVPIKGSEGKILYYLIPDGRGNWMRTDPRRDAVRVKEVTEKHAVDIRVLLQLKME
jgi:hypothetical protein